MKFLIDENLSPKIVHHLVSLGYEAMHVRDQGLRGKTDQEICRWAKENSAVVITRDLDFGLLYRQKYSIGILILRSKNDNTLATTLILNQLHKNGYLSQKNLLAQLTVSTETKIRIFKNTPLTN